VQVFTVGLIGAAVSRSLSPAMHDAAFTFHGLGDRYTLWSIAAAELPDLVRSLRVAPMRGANVTIPYKASVLPLLDDWGDQPDVRALGAVNTIVRREDGTLLGLNTDVEGFHRALLAGGYVPRDTSAVLLGAGGAARAVAWALIGAGVRSLTVVNRSPERTAALFAMLPDVAAPIAPSLVALRPDDDAVSDAITAATLLVNATPVGSDDVTLPLAPDMLHPGLFVSDLIYRSTPLLRMAAQVGARTQDGLEMLVQQGALAFEAWTGLAAPVDVMRAAALQVRSSAS
jgi:shikimate dehydrogenase